MNLRKLKVGEIIRVKATQESLDSLVKMRIDTALAGKTVHISQVSPHGVSFELPWTKLPTIELHLGIGHVENVFGKRAA